MKCNYWEIKWRVRKSSILIWECFSQSYQRPHVSARGIVRSQLRWNKQSQSLRVIRHLLHSPRADRQGDMSFCGILCRWICHMKKPRTRLCSLKWDLEGSMAFCWIFPGLNALCSTTNCIWKSVKLHDQTGHKPFCRNIKLLPITQGLLWCEVIHAILCTLSYPPRSLAQDICVNMHISCMCRSDISAAMNGILLPSRQLFISAWEFLWS